MLAPPSILSQQFLKALSFTEHLPLGYDNKLNILSPILVKVFLSIWEFVSCTRFQVRVPNVFLSCWVEDIQLFFVAWRAVADLPLGWLIIWVAGSKTCACPDYGCPTFPLFGVFQQYFIRLMLLMYSNVVIGLSVLTQFIPSLNCFILSIGMTIILSL